MWGPTVVESPHIDHLANEGAICTRFYATCPVCSPSRASFVSGMYPQSTAVVGNDIPMEDSIITFAEVLRRTGYATGYAGEWHLVVEPLLALVGEDHPGDGAQQPADQQTGQLPSERQEDPSPLGPLDRHLTH